MDPSDEIHRSFGRLFDSWLVNTRSVAARIDPELGYNGLIILSWLTYRESARLTDVADQFGVGKGTMSRQLAALEERRHVVRQACVDDGRTVLFSVTPSTKEAIARARSDDWAWRKDALSHWDPDELALLAQLLKRITDLEESR